MTSLEFSSLIGLRDYREAAWFLTWHYSCYNIHATLTITFHSVPAIPSIFFSAAGALSLLVLLQGQRRSRPPAQGTSCLRGPPGGLQHASLSCEGSAWCAPVLPSHCSPNSSNLFSPFMVLDCLGPLYSRLPQDSSDTNLVF